MSLKKSKYGNVFPDLPKVRINVLEISKTKDFTFTYEINKSVGIKDLNGKDKRIYKSTFTPNTNYLQEKWEFIENHFKQDKDFEIPYKIKIQGDMKYLNLIFKNDYFKALKEKAEKQEKKKNKDEDVIDESEN